MSSHAPLAPPPGVERSRRFRPRWHYELLVCGLRGHELIGTEVAEVRAQDSAVLRQGGGVRWCRCLRCDSWLPISPPQNASKLHLSQPADTALPARGRALRDKIILRAIAVDRAFHFVLLSFLGVLVFFIASHQHELQQRLYRVLTDIQGGIGGGPVQIWTHGSHPRS